MPARLPRSLRQSDKDMAHLSDIPTLSATFDCLQPLLGLWRAKLQSLLIPTARQGNIRRDSDGAQLPQRLRIIGIPERKRTVGRTGCGRALEK